MRIDAPSIARLRKRIHRQVRGFGGQSDETTRSLMTWIMHAVREWAKAEEKR